jgi:hypothetical protein
MSEQPIKVPCFMFPFSVPIYQIGLSYLHRYDGMCIKAHPVVAAIIQDVIKDQQFRLPIVPDHRNRPNEVAILDLSSTGAAVVEFEALGTPSGCEAFEKVQVNA